MATQPPSLGSGIAETWDLGSGRKRASARSISYFVEHYLVPVLHTIPKGSLMFAALPGFPFSQKDLENLKAEVQRRQQLQESIKSGGQLEPEDKAVEEKEAEPSMPSAEIPLTQSSA